MYMYMYGRGLSRLTIEGGKLSNGAQQRATDHSLGIVHPGRGAVEVLLHCRVVEERLLVALQQE